MSLQNLFEKRQPEQAVVFAEPNLSLTLFQFEIALALFMNGPTPVSALGSRIKSGRAKVREALNHLACLGFVLRERDPDNRRVVLCKLSDQGQWLMAGVWNRARLNHVFSA